MKIAITATGKEASSAMDPRFGRATFFIVVDTETNAAVAHDNAQNLNAAQDAGIQAAETVARLGAAAVIASVSGASQVLVVTEPTLSGAHDMARVLELTRQVKIPAAVCVNKWDLNAEMADAIEAEARRAGATIAGRVRYDRAVTAAQLQGRAVVEMDAGPLAADIRAVWGNLWQ